MLINKANVAIFQCVTSHSIAGFQTTNMKALKFLLAFVTIYEVLAVPEEDCRQVIDRVCAATDVPSLNIKPYLWFANKCFFEKTKRLGTNNFGKNFPHTVNLIFNRKPFNSQPHWR